MSDAPILSLRVKHSWMSAGSIASILECVPDRAWDAGSDRTTPTGRSLGGVNSTSYVAVRLDNELSSLDASINHALSELSGSALSVLRAEGASVEIYATVDVTRRGFTVAPETMDRLASNNVALAVDWC